MQPAATRKLVDAPRARRHRGSGGRVDISAGQVQAAVDSNKSLVTSGRVARARAISRGPAGRGRLAPRLRTGRRGLTAVRGASDNRSHLLFSGPANRPALKSAAAVRS